MNQIAAIALLMSTALLAACGTPNVKYADLQPATTASISGNTLTIHLGTSVTNSAFWTRPEARVKVGTVYVVGFLSMRGQSREFVVRLPASATDQAVSLVWVDPDGSRVEIPIAK